jgi:hypothetical protein
MIPTFRTSRAGPWFPSIFRASAALEYSSVRVCRRRGKRSSVLCQNCVRYPPKLLAHTVIYGDTRMHIVVAGSR